MNVLQSFNPWDHMKTSDGNEKCGVGSGTSDPKFAKALMTDTKACYRVYRDQNGSPIYD